MKIRKNLKPGVYLSLAAIAYMVVVYLLEQHILGGAIPLFDDRPKTPLFLNAAALLAALCVVHVLFRRTSVSLMLTCALIVPITIAHLVKLSFRREPLTPSDLILAKEAMDLGKDFLNVETVLAVSVFVLAFGFGILKLKSFDSEARKRTRGALFLLAGLYISLILYYPETASKKEILANLSLQDVVKEPVKTLGQNGFVMDFLLKLRADLNEKTPLPSYSKSKIKSILQAEQGSEESSAEAVKPNVIVYVMESFTDPAELGIKTTMDPIPNFRSLSQKRSGRLITPAFGGNTNNVEFEVLTGLAIKAQSRQTGPFHHYVHHALPALPRIFKSNGYRAMAIHPYYGWYWSRHLSYPHLGFEKFYDDKTFLNPKKTGHFISDLEVVKRIKTLTSDESQSFFIFALTVAGHGPYDWHTSAEEETLVDSSVPSSAQEKVHTYLELVKEADKALGELVSHFSKQKKPTLIIAFGDHLPPLGNDFYSKTSFGRNQTTEFSDMPYAVWANYPIDQDLPQALPSYALGAEILQMAKLKPEPIFSLAHKVGKAQPYYTSKSESASVRSDFPDYRLLQYDLLLGERHYFGAKAELDQEPKSRMTGIISKSVDSKP